MEDVVQRFLRYVKYDTRSNEISPAYPSTDGQLVFAQVLADELAHMGLKDACVDQNGYVTATLTSNVSSNVPAIGFISHMDTSPDMPGHDVRPRIIENYGGSDIILNRDMGIVLSPSEFPHLRNYIGQDIIVTDGTTLLGADDKAGVAEIMTAVKFLLEHPEVKHGTVKVCFTPDEEVGRGVDRFDTAKFGAAFAYTVDGGEIGELNYENFNAAAARIKINGKSIHTGDAKGKMKNAVLIGMELNDMLPPDEIPANTEGYEGFYHINNFDGNVDHADAYYLIRDFDKKGFEDRKNFMKDIAGKLNAKYGTDTVSMDLYDQYYNMKEIIERHMYAIDIAKAAMQQAGVQPLILPIRGGTDGARLSYMGLPTPNIFTGGHNFHGRYEYIPVQSMQKAVEVIVNIAINCCTYPWPS